jgi:hypothetical protein
MGLAVLLLTSSPAGAWQDTPTVGESMIGERQFIGAAARDGVVVRSGPSTSHLTVLTLAHEQEVVVVAASGEFLRILAPEGAFCLVPKARVELTGASEGDLRVGRVTQPCSVRAGSRITENPGETTARLSIDDEVRIIDEDSTYYKVLPPKAVFFYVDKNDMLRVREVAVTGTRFGWAVSELGMDPVAEAGDAEAPPEATGAGAGAAGGEAIAQGDQGTAAPEEPVEGPEVVNPTTRPAILAEIEELDARYAEAAKLPLEEQPLEAMKQEYAAKLAVAEADKTLALAVPALKARIDAITIRQEALAEAEALQAKRAEMEKRQLALEAERNELEQLAAGTKVTVFAAVGQLQPSTLQIGSGSLFRLCDPATGRTLIYLRAEGEVAKNLARHVEKFVGIKGESAVDEQLDVKLIKVAEVAGVDPQQVFKSVAAEIIPPSLVQNAAAGD